MTEVLFNPFDPAFRANPYPFYDTLREQAPVYLSPFETVVLSRYEDVGVTLRSNDFSRDIEKNANPPTNPLQTRKRERRSDDSSKSILNLDPPDHTRLRRLASLAFTPSATRLSSSSSVIPSSPFAVLPVQRFHPHGHRELGQQ